MERQRIKERCDAGRLAAREALEKTGKTHRGKSGPGRPKASDPEAVRKWRQENGATITRTMAQFGISKNTVSRYCAAG
jgi:putative DNA-invertase from lambdoid prophage Rac